MSTTLRRIPVDVRRMDDVFLSLPAINYIKIDAEGGEWHILRGAAECIWRFRPTVSFEFGANAFEPYDVSASDVFEFWKSNGYKVYDVRARPLRDADAFARSAYEQAVWGYLALPAEDTITEAKVRSVLGATCSVWMRPCGRVPSA